MEKTHIKITSQNIESIFKLAKDKIDSLPVEKPFRVFIGGKYRSGKNLSDYINKLMEKTCACGGEFIYGKCYTTDGHKEIPLPNIGVCNKCGKTKDKLNN